VDAATEARDKTLETGTKSVNAARNVGNEALGRPNSVKDKLSSGIAEQAPPTRGRGGTRRGGALT
jgi:hypothetical protein